MSASAPATATVRVVAKRAAPVDTTAAASPSVFASAATSSPSGLAVEAPSKKPRYEQRCLACMRRLLHFLLVNDMEPAAQNASALASSDLTKHHHMLKFSDAALEKAKASSSRGRTSSGKPDTAILAREYLKLQRNVQFEGRSKAQNEWIDSNINLDENVYCTDAGLKSYEEFLKRLTKKTKAGGEQHLGMEGQKAYTKAISRYFKTIGFFPDLAHKERVKELHKRTVRAAAKATAAAAVQNVTAKAIVASADGQTSDATVLHRLASSEKRLEELSSLLQELNRSIPKMVADEVKRALAVANSSNNVAPSTSSTAVPVAASAVPAPANDSRSTGLPIVATSGCDAGLTPATEWAIPAADGLPERVVVVPPEHPLEDVSLGVALSLWELGQPLLPDPTTGRENRIRPFRLLEKSHWTSPSSAKHFAAMQKVMRALSPLTSLVGKVSLRQFVPVVSDCIDHFSHNSGNGGAERPVKRSVTDIAKHMAARRATEKAVTEWYNKHFAGAAASSSR